MNASSSSIKPILMALAFVCFGATLGVFVDRLYLSYQNKKSQNFRPSKTEEVTLVGLKKLFSDTLNLSPSQAKKFSSILNQHLRRGLKFFKNRPPAVVKFLKKGMKIRDDFRKSVRKILDPKQKKKFNTMLRRADSQRIELQLQRLKFQKQLRDELKKK